MRITLPLFPTEVFPRRSPLRLGDFVGSDPPAVVFCFVLLFPCHSTEGESKDPYAYCDSQCESAWLDHALCLAGHAPDALGFP
jgi:hypothetical protein